MNTIFSLKSVSAFILSVLLLGSCQQQISEVGVPKPVSTNGLTPLESRAPALYQKINNRFEDYGQFAYYHLKYHPVANPIDYLPEFNRKVFDQALQKVASENKGLTIDERLTKLKVAGLMDEESYSIYSKFFKSVNDDLKEAKSVEEVWNLLREKEKGLVSSDPDHGTDALIVFSSMLRNVTKYNWESEEADIDAARLNPKLKKANARMAGCFLGITTSCWGNVLGQTFIDGLTAGIAGGLNPGKDQTGKDKTFWNGLANAGLIGAGINLIKNTYTAYNNASCGCGTTAPVCEEPQGFRLIISDCSLTQSFQIIGGGTSANNFNYSVQNGSFPEFSNSSNVVNTGAKLIKVTQTSPNQQILLTGSVVCSTGQVIGKSQYFNIYDLTRDPNPIGISGAVNVNFNDPSNWDYILLNGGDAVNPNNTYIWSRNWAGQTVAGGANNENYIRIKWTYRTNMARVYLQSQNQCSGNQAVSELAVNVY